MGEYDYIKDPELRKRYEQYVNKTLNDKEYMRQNRPGLFSMEYPKEYIQDYKKSLGKK